MKKLFLFIILFCSFSIYAQTLTYPIDTINGKTFYRYSVQKSEGLYRISKNFDVSQEDIVKYNPELQHSGLKLGQTILIPVVLPVDSSQYTIHRLQAKETLYGVSKKYGVKIADVEKLNPETSKTMRIGECLLIPLRPQLLPTDVVKNENKEEKVQQKTVIREPIIAKTIESETLTAEDSNPKITNDTIPDANDLQLSVSDTASTLLRLVVMLPFMPDATERDANLERFTEFYEGLLLAVNKAQTDGQRFEIYTYDTDKTEARIYSVLSDTTILKADVIIGPAYPAQTAIVADYAKEHKIPMIVPFTSKVSGIETNPYILQFNPTEQVEAEAIVKWTQNAGEPLNWIFFNDNNMPACNSAQTLYDELTKHNAHIVDATVNRLLVDSVADLFAFGKLNMVVLPWDKFNSVQHTLAHLVKIKQQYRVCLVSEYAWQKETINLPQIYTNLFETNSGLSAENIVYKLTRMNYFPYEVKNTAPRYDLLGYDLTSWIIKVLQHDGKDIAEKIAATGHTNGLQSDLDFYRISTEGGWMNKAVKVINK